MKAAEALFEAVREGNVPRVRELLEALPHLARTEAILHAAACVPGYAGDGGPMRPEHRRDVERGEVTRLLLSRGAEADARNGRMATALHLAARYDLPSVVAALLRSGADVNARDIEGATPLHRAMSLGHHAVAELLLAHGACPAATHRGE